MEVPRPSGTPLIRRLRKLLWTVVAVLTVAAVAVVAVTYLRHDEQPVAGDGPPAYPLRVSADHRHLVDQNDHPQFMAADTAWNLFSRLSDDEVAQYLDARQQQGFTTILTSAVDISAGGIDGVNRDGQTPFTDGFGHPNPAYFDHVDAVLEQAADRGLSIVMVPAWLSAATEQPSYTTENAFSYGTWLGERYAETANLIWMVGGDWGSVAGAEGMCPKEAETRALAEGIRSADQRHLMTYHPGAGLASSMCYNDAEWLDINSNYWDFDDQNVSSAYRFMYRDHPNSPTRPTIMIETGYEGPFPTDPVPDALTARTSRMQSYFMVLSGAFGFTYGANQTYAMDNGNPNAARTWQETLTIPGGFHQGYVARLFSDLPWWKLEPDRSMVIGGAETEGEQDYVTSARAADGTLAVAYVPDPRVVTVDMSRFAGPVDAQWFDPTNNTFVDAGTSVKNTGSHEFDPPATNSAGDGDFVLVLRAR